MPDLATKSGVVIKCPACGNWVARVDSLSAQIELNCKNARCGKTISIIVREQSRVTVEVAPKFKQAT